MEQNISNYSILIIFSVIIVILILLRLYSKVMLLLGYNKYEYTKRLKDGGSVNVTEWHKSHSKALSSNKTLDDVTMIKPYYRKLKVKGIVID